MADKSLESASTVPSSYQVFLSFRGKDTRNTFIAHLHNALVNAGIETYKDDQRLKRVKEIEASLLQAIQDSRISIPVFSKNYASSTWCLRELTEIIKCKRERSQAVLPVFLSVDPSNVRRQTGTSFKKAFLRHEKRFGKETVDRWREAMTEAANLSGLSLKDAPANGDEAKLVKLVVKEISSKLNYDTPLDVAKHPVGIDYHLEYMTKLLNVESNKVFFVGICGMGGLGKTTIVKAVFNKIFSCFEGSCFLDDVRENSEKKGLVSLQNKLLSKILNRKHDVDTVSRGITMIKERINAKKVLIVLDDVDDKNQLDSLAGGPDWFGLGSRIIITTRDKKVLNVHGVDKIYEPKEMDLTQSLQLFSKHAFGSDQPPEGYMDLSEKIVFTTGGLPLALEVLGSCLFGETKQSYWESTLKKLKKIPRPEVQKKLQISFDELDYEEKEIFLDIACFFIGMDKEDVIYIWDGCDFSSTIGIEVLIKKSLVKIGDDNKLWMHDQLRDMGRKIVHEDGGRDPGKYSRLWDRADVFDVLKKQMGSTNVKGLVLHFKEIEVYKSRPTAVEEGLLIQGSTNVKGLVLHFKEIEGYKSRPTAVEEGRLRTEAFAAMSQLRLLRVDYAHLDGDFERFPPELRWLSWRGCPLEFIPTNFHMEKLVVLDLSRSNIKRVWDEWYQNQVVKTLKVLDLSLCTNLIRTPDFAGFRCLERLNLQGCSRLEEVHRSIGNLKKLIYLNLKWCGSLVEVPSSIFKLDSLKDLFLSGCSTLKKLPDLDGMKSLRKLYLDGTAIEQLPDSIGCLKNISLLSLEDCVSLRILPNSLGKLESLRELFLDGTAIEQLPDSIGCLKNLSVLSLKYCISLRILPNSLGKLESLRKLRLNKSGVEKLPFSIGALKKLEILSLDDCRSLTVLPNSIGDLLKLPRLSLEGCKFLGKLPDTLWRIESLIELNLEWIDEIREIPEFHGSQSKLEKLTIRFCKSFSRLPDSMGNLESLRELILNGTPIENIPDSIGSLKKLEELRIAWCGSLTNLPNGIGFLEKLEKLSIRQCKKLVKLPDSMGKLRLLKEIRMVETGIVELPKDFGMLQSLKVLDMFGCQEFKGLPESFASLLQLDELKLAYCTKMEYLPELPSSLVELDVRYCLSLERLADLSNLEKLKVLSLSNCEKLREIEGIERLKSLSELSMIGCNNINRNTLRKIFVQGAFECLKTFSFPGSDIPDWFDHQEFPSVVCIPPDYDIRIYTSQLE